MYYLNADYNPEEPGYPYLLNDFAKIGVTRDAFLLFYDEFPLLGAPGSAAASSTARRSSPLTRTRSRGPSSDAVKRRPQHQLQRCHREMGLLATPDGTCAGSVRRRLLVAVIPAQPADSGQLDNHYGGTGFMVSALDFKSFFGYPSAGDNRVAAWDWTGLGNLNSGGCGSCSAVKFGGQLFTGRSLLRPGEHPRRRDMSTQKAGPIPLGQAVRRLHGSHESAPVPKTGSTQRRQHDPGLAGPGPAVGGTMTEVNQLFASRLRDPQRRGLLGDRYRLVRQDRAVHHHQPGNVSAAHEDLEFPPWPLKAPTATAGRSWTSR